MPKRGGDVPPPGDGHAPWRSIAAGLGSGFLEYRYPHVFRPKTVISHRVKGGAFGSEGDI